MRSARDVPVWVIAAETAPIEPEAELVAAGVEVMRVSVGPDGHLDLHEALKLLGTRGITRVFSEGGPRIGEQLALSGLADEIVTLFLATPFDGGRHARRVGQITALEADF